MSPDDLSVLGAAMNPDEGVDVHLADGTVVHLDEHALADPARMRAAVYAATGVELPHYDHDDHAKSVQVILSLAGFEVVEDGGE
jgi:hypothetical protein